MMTALDHPLVQDYLDQLLAETGRLAGSEGRELQMQIREHLTEALPDEPVESEVRDVLDRLGDPADLVDAAGGVDPAAAMGRRDEPEGAWREAGALLALVGWTLLFWLPVINLVLWVGGLVLLFLSRRWSVADKVWGAAVLGLGPLPFAVGGAFAWLSQAEVCVSDETGVVSCTGGDGGLTALNIVTVTLTVVYLVLYVWTLVRLARKAARKDA